MKVESKLSKYFNDRTYSMAVLTLGGLAGASHALINNHAEWAAIDLSLAAICGYLWKKETSKHPSQPAP